MRSTADLVSEILERERRAHGFTWKELAADLKVNTVTLWKWRKGRGLGPAADVLVPLAIKHCAALTSDQSTPTS